MATGPTLTRDRVISELEGMVCDALSRLADESGTSANVTMVDRTREAEVQDEDDGAISLDCGRSVTRRAESGFVARKQLAQTWVVVAQLHDALVSGKKMTQRELWYRLKTTELFSGPPQVNERILDVCAAVSFRCGVPCPRESVGIVAAPRVTMGKHANPLPLPIASTVTGNAPTPEAVADGCATACANACPKGDPSLFAPAITL